MARAALENLDGGRDRAAEGGGRDGDADPEHGGHRLLQQRSGRGLGEDGHGPAHRRQVDRSTTKTVPAGRSRRPKRQRLGRSECRRKRCSAETAYGDWQGPLRGAKQIVEPVFGHDEVARRGIREFLLRGLEKVSAEWQLICLTHNLLKIWRRSCSVGARLRGIVRAQGGAEAEKARAQRNPAAMREHEQIFGQAPSHRPHAGRTRRPDRDRE